MMITDPSLAPLTQGGKTLCLVYKTPSTIHWRPLAAVEIGTASWDGAPSGSIAVLSTFHQDVWSYVQIQVTGRKPTPVPGGGSVYGIKVQVTWDSGARMPAWIAVTGGFPRADLGTVIAQVAAATEQTTKKGD